MSDDGRLPTDDAPPEGWVWMTLGDVVEQRAEQILPSQFPDHPFNYLALENIEQGTGRIINFEPTLGAEIKSNKFRFTTEHALYGKLRPYLRKAVAPDFGGISATDLLPLKPRAGVLDRHFLVWWLLSPQVLEYVTLRQTGVKMPRLRTGDLTKMPVPLPPLPEQRRIVARLEALLGEARTARQALERIPSLLARFRQAVLTAAFRGELTGNHRPLTTNGLPEGWERKTLPQLGELARGKSKHRPRDYERLYGGPYPFVQTGDIARAKGTVTTYSQTYSELGLAQSRLWPKGTLCITIAANIADTAILGFDACFPDSVVGFVADETVCDVRFVEFFIRTAKSDLEQFAPATAQKNINLGTLRKLAVPLPPLAEQHRIVARIQALFAQADTIEAAATAVLGRLPAVEQSILARAFRGELAPHDPDDEPALALLE